MGRRVRRLSRVNQDRVADVSSHIDESLHEIRTVQAYVHEDANHRPVQRGDRGGLCRRPAPDSHQGMADLAGHADRVLRRRRHPLDRRPRRVRRPHDGGRVVRFRFLCRGGCHRRRDGVRGVGRDPARRGRDRAADGTARYAASRSLPRRLSSRCRRACPARFVSTRSHFPTRRAPKPSRSGRYRSPSIRASALRWSAHRARESPPSSR